MRGCNRWLVFFCGALLALSLRAEVKPLVVAESDSFHSLTYGLSAFCQAADFPFALTEINSAASELLFVPNLAGVDVQNRLCWAAVEDGSRTNDSTVSVAILPTLDNGATVLRALEAFYPVRTTDADGRIWRYAHFAAATNLPADSAFNVPEMAVFAAIHQGHVVVSTARAGVEWGMRNIPPAGNSVAKAGQVRIEIKPAAVAAMMKKDRETQAHDLPDEGMSTEGVERLLADLSALTLVLDATADGITVQMTAVPRPDSLLAKMSTQLRMPAERMWRMAPDNAALVVVEGGADARGFLREYDLLPENKLTKGTLANVGAWDEHGDVVLYVDHNSAAGIYLAAVQVVTNRDRAWAQALATPQALLPMAPTVAMVTNGVRNMAGCRVVDFSFTPAKGPRTTAPNFMDMALVMQPAMTLSVAMTNDLMISVLGRSNAVEQVLRRLQEPVTNGTPALLARCRKQLPDLPAAPFFVAQIGPVALMRMIVDALPSETADLRVAFPQPGDGLTAVMVTETNGAMRFVLRVPANEVSRVKTAAEKAQTAVRDGFSHMAVEQMFQKRDGDLPPEMPLPKK
jgi:hypothetical protein